MMYSSYSGDYELKPPRPWIFPRWAILAMRQLATLLSSPGDIFQHDKRNTQLITDIYKLEAAFDQTLIDCLSQHCPCHDKSCARCLDTFTHLELRGVGKWLIEEGNVDVRECWEGFLEDIYLVVIELIYRSWWSRRLYE